MALVPATQIRNASASKGSFGDMTIDVNSRDLAILPEQVAIVKGQGTKRRKGSNHDRYSQAMPGLISAACSGQPNTMITR